MKPKSRRKTATYVATLGMLLGLGITLPIGSAVADPIEEDECFPAVLMLRGSGEKPIGVSPNWKSGDPVNPFNYHTGSDPLITTNGHEGPTLFMALNSMVHQTNPADTVSRLRFIGIDYPALAVEPPKQILPDTSGLDAETAGAVTAAAAVKNAAADIDHYVNYVRSIDQGAINVKRFIEKDSENCDTQYILMGYSQGALAARVAMNLMGNNTDKVIASYLIGDPYQKANAATPEQRSVASTGFHRDGVMRNALSLLIGFADGIAVNPDSLSGDMLREFRTRMNRSDLTTYRNDPIANIYSRSLCHDYDMVCWTSPIERPKEIAHLNYFTPGTADGNLDILHDTPGFDAQLKRLADSQPISPRGRELVSTSSVLGLRMAYAIANMRSGDKCSWDRGSDGTFESIKIPCGVYEIDPSDANPKMTVKVYDKFETLVYENGLNLVSIDPQVIKTAVDIPVNSWIRFESYGRPNQCLGLSPDFQNQIDSFSLKLAICLSSSIPDYEVDPSQVFKKTGASTSSSYSRPRDHFVWGKDERFKLVVEGFAVNENRPIGRINAIQDMVQGVRAELTRITNGEAYYQLKVLSLFKEVCLSSDPSSPGLKYAPCNMGDSNQLFKAKVVAGNYG